MKIVVDTNVLISGVYFGGYPYRILEAWSDGRIVLVVSREILSEYLRVGGILAGQYPGVKFKPIFELIRGKAVLVKTRRLYSSICADPDDDKFFSCALAAGSKMIISGDKHLLKVSGFNGIDVLKPREFVEIYLQN